MSKTVTFSGKKFHSELEQKMERGDKCEDQLGKGGEEAREKRQGRVDEQEEDKVGCGRNRRRGRQTVNGHVPTKLKGTLWEMLPAEMVDTKTSYAIWQ